MERQTHRETGAHRENERVCKYGKMCVCVCGSIMAVCSNAEEDPSTLWAGLEPRPPTLCHGGPGSSWFPVVQVHSGSASLHSLCLLSREQVPGKKQLERGKL